MGTNNKTMAVLVIILSLIVLGLGGYIVYDKYIKKTPETNITNNEETPKQEEPKEETPKEETPKEITNLTLKDFPLKDDMEGDYIKFKGLLTYIKGGKVEKNTKTYNATFNNYSFTLKAVKTVCPGGTGNTGTLEAESLSLTVNNKTVYNKKGPKAPYIVITDKYLIVLYEEIEHYDDEGFEDNLEKLGNIIIYDKDMNKKLGIRNINTYEMTNKYGLLNASLGIAIKDNVLYYVVADKDSRTLKYVDLNKDELTETTVETFSAKGDIARNDTITSINQFPYIGILDLPDTINGYTIKINYNKDIFTISKDGTEVKRSKFYTRYVNPNSTTFTLLGDNGTHSLVNNKVYYLKKNSDETLSLIEIDFDNELAEKVIEKFSLLEYKDENIYFGSCNR